MARTKVMRTDNDDVFNTDMAVRSFCKSHKGDLSEEEHAELRRLLRDRANALSDVLGFKVGSIGDRD